MKQPTEAIPAKEVHASPGSHAELYDFKHPKLVSKEIMGILRKIHDMYARNLKRIFANILNSKAEVNMLDIEQVVFSEYLNEVEPPSALFLFNIEELGDWALLQMEPEFCINFVERQSGGTSDKQVEARTLTRIEERVMSRTIDRMVKELCQVWSSYIEMTIINHVYESKPANVRTISSHVPGIRVVFALKVDDMAGQVSLCYPYALLKEKMMDSVNKFNKPDEQTAMSASEKRRFQANIKEATVTMRALLGGRKLSFHDLVSMTEGDVIKLDQPINKPLQILVNNAPKMVGFPGNLNGKRAIKIFQVNQSKTTL